MTFDDFINKYINKGIDYDNTAGIQCVDLVKQYLHDLWNICPGSWGNAHAYYDNFSSHKELTENFNKIANTPDLVPKRGDICVWSKSLNGNYGHIAIADGEGNTNYFYSYDQNWNGRHDPVTRVKHNYKHFSGVLRPKDRSRITKKAQSITPANSNTYFKAGDAVKLNGVALYVSSDTPNKSCTKIGTYYVYDNIVKDNRIKITNSKANCGKKGMVTGWVNVKDITEYRQESIPATSYYPKSSYTGVSLVEALKKAGISSSYAFRTKIASANGIKNYTGTASQNTTLLDLLKTGKLIKV